MLDRHNSLTPIQRQIETVVTNGTGYSDRFWRNRHNWALSFNQVPEHAGPVFEYCASKSSMALLALRDRKLDADGLRKFIDLERIRVDFSFDSNYLSYYDRPLGDSSFPAGQFLRSILVA